MTADDRYFHACRPFKLQVRDSTIQAIGYVYGGGTGCIPLLRSDIETHATLGGLKYGVLGREVDYFIQRAGMPFVNYLDDGDTHGLVIWVPKTMADEISSAERVSSAQAWLLDHEILMGALILSKHKPTTILVDIDNRYNDITHEAEEYVMQNVCEGVHKDATNESVFETDVAAITTVYERADEYLNKAVYPTNLAEMFRNVVASL